MGILDGKRILVAGVTMDSSIGFAVARFAQEQGASGQLGRREGTSRRHEVPLGVRRSSSTRPAQSMSSATTAMITAPLTRMG